MHSDLSPTEQFAFGQGLVALALSVDSRLCSVLASAEWISETTYL